MLLRFISQKMFLCKISVLLSVIIFTGGSILGKNVKTILNNVNTGVPDLLDAESNNLQLHPDYGLNIYGFLNKYGYPIETYNVTTEDGYILTLHRIPHGRDGNHVDKLKPKPAVLLQHGLACSSVDWINRGSNISLGLMLADQGWDVWLGNNRGTTWSRKHTHLNPDTDKEFWAYSFHECGYYDMPAVIDFILAKTNHTKIFYVGHSQGTTQFFAMAASRPEYNEKIALMTALAPVAFSAHLSSPIFKILAKYINIVVPLVDKLNITHLDYLPGLAKFGKKYCAEDNKFSMVCGFVIFFITGFNQPQFDMSFIPVMLYNFPAGISLRMLTHFGQNTKSGYFRQYDYGRVNNWVHYKSFEPPKYDLSKITAPIALYYSTNDLLATVPDVEQLAARLPNVTRKHIVADKYFTHLDFLWANDAKPLLNNMVIEKMFDFIVVNEGSNAVSINTLLLVSSFIIIHQFF